jgi:hypothetical protein
VSLRRRAVAAGFGDPVPFRTVPALAPLRGRADFRLPLMDLNMLPDPFALAYVRDFLLCMTLRDSA